MDTLAVSLQRYCCVCFNNENNITLAQNLDKFIKNCETYLKPTIIIKPSKDEIARSCCNYCYESVNQLTLLTVKIEKLQKELFDLSSLFSKNVSQRRRRFENVDAECGNQLIHTTDDSLLIHKSSDLNYDFEIYNDSVKEKTDEIGLEEIPSESEHNEDKIKIGELFTDPLFDTDGHDNVTKSVSSINLNTNFNISCSGDEIVPNTFDNVDKLIPSNTLILSTTTADCNHQTTTSSWTNLLACVKLPTIRLKKIQSSRIRNLKMSAADLPIVNIKSELNGPDIDPVPGVGNNYHPNEKPTEVLVTPSETAKLTNDERDESSGTALFNESVFAEEAIIKCENNLDENQLHSCFICGKDFQKMQDLKDHGRLHMKQKSPYACSFCDKSFRKTSALKIHEIIHTGDRPFKCSFCPKSFIRICNWKDHERYHSTDKPFKCSICEKNFVISRDLKQHEITHSEERRYKCSVCEKTFKSPKTLKAHEKIHSTEKPNKCSFCKNTFMTPSLLKIHERIHTGERPFNCSVCSKAFRSSTSLKEHEITHSEERPYQCPFCDKSFRTAGKLTNHKTFHKGERPYKCSSCTMTFKRQQHLTNHHQIKHKDEYIIP